MIAASSSATWHRPERHAAFRRLQRITVPGLLLTVAVSIIAVAAVVAPPIRTGDAQQYVVMARQLAAGQPPWLDRSALEQQSAWLRAQPARSGFPDGASALRQPSLARDGVQELSHFWLYPLLSTPALLISTWLGQPPTVAFAVTNVLLLALAIGAAARAFGPVAALVLLASPLIWFVARSQVEIFMFSMVLLAISLAARDRWMLGAIALALAATQNLPVAAGVPLFWIGGVVRNCQLSASSSGGQIPPSVRLRRAWQPLLCALFFVLIHPAFYAWRLGVLTPQQLNGGIAPALPDAQRLIAPVLDPDIGLLWWAPLPVILAVGGAVRWGRGRSASTFSPWLLTICSALALWFLYTFSRTTNVNSGGTVHISRYALWLLPLLAPFIAVALPARQTRVARVFPVAVAVVAGAYLITFQPDQPERYVEHSPQAQWLMAHALPLCWQLPEVFVERSAHIDGGARVSAADPGCSLLYLVPGSEPPCAVSSGEASMLAASVARGDPGVWIRRRAAQFWFSPPNPPVEGRQ